MSGSPEIAEGNGPTDVARGRFTLADWTLAGALCTLTVLLPAMASIGAGSFSIAQSDDWSYRRIAEHFAQTGHLVSTGYTSMTLVGQVLWSWPFFRLFGIHGWVPGASTAVLGVVGVTCGYYVARGVLARSSAILALLLIAVFPGFARGTSTFMTDGPAFAAEMLCIALGMVALGHDGWRRWTILGASMLAGVFGFSIREFAVAAPAAVLIGVGASDLSRRRTAYMALGVCVVALCVATFIWSAHNLGGTTETLTGPSRQSLLRLVKSYFELAAMLSPAVAIKSWRCIRWRLSPTTVAIAVTLLIGVAVDRYSHGLFVGNFLDPRGPGGNALLLGVRPILLPAWLWDSLTTIGLGSGAMLAGILVEVVHPTIHFKRTFAWSTPEGVLKIFASLVALGLTIYALTTVAFFERYLWPLSFVVGVLLLFDGRRLGVRERSKLPIGLAIALFVLLAVLTAALTENSYTYDAARWRAGLAVMAQGVRPTEIDAGFEWVGAHATGVANRSLHPASPPYEPWYALMEPGFRECAVVSNTPLTYSTLHLVHKTNYELVGVLGRRTLYAYLSSVPGC